MTLIDPRRILPEDLLDGFYGPGEIATATGRIVNPWFMQPGDFALQDIGPALSKLCRYAGQIPSFYSVAEHCVWAFDEAAGDGVTDLATLRAIFMHDASEAYLVDVPAPVKKQPGMRPYRYAEDRLQVALGKRYRFDLFDPITAETVKKYDQAAYRFETTFLRQGLITGLQPCDAEEEWWRVAADLDLSD